MKANAALGALTIGLTLAAAPGPAQAPPAQAPPTPEQAVPVFGVESSIVLLDVVVRDKRGRLIRDLKASDFEVYEDGQKQAVGAFRVVDNGVDLLAPSGGNAAVGTARATVATPPPAPLRTPRRHPRRQPAVARQPELERRHRPARRQTLRAVRT